MMVSPKIIQDLMEQIVYVLKSKYGNHDQKIESYFFRWRKGGYSFELLNRHEDGVSYLWEMLSKMDDDLLLKIAVDLGIEVPGLIYSVAEIKDFLAADYKAASAIFENAIKNMYDDPSASVCQANSALESIIKQICENGDIPGYDSKMSRASLRGLVPVILEEFRRCSDGRIRDEMDHLCSNLIEATNSIQNIRNKYTDTAHGKTSDDYVIDDPLYVCLFINAVTTVGLFLLNFYEHRYLPAREA